MRSGVLNAYRACVPQLHFSGPSYVNTIIEHAVDVARTYGDGRHYVILLILTDGEIDDIRESITVNDLYFAAAISDSLVDYSFLSVFYTRRRS